MAERRTLEGIRKRIKQAEFFLAKLSVARDRFPLETYAAACLDALRSVPLSIRAALEQDLVLSGLDRGQAAAEWGRIIGELESGLPGEVIDEGDWVNRFGYLDIY